MSHTSPSPVKNPRISVTSSLPGIWTVTPALAIAVDATATMRKRPRKRVKGSGSRLPTRSTPSSSREPQPRREAVVSAVMSPSRSVEVVGDVERAALGGELGVDGSAQLAVAQVVQGGEGQADGAVERSRVGR